MTSGVTAAKNRLRADILAARAASGSAARAAAGEAIAAHALTAWPGVGRVAAYLSVGTEPPTGPLLDQLTARGVHVIVPVVVGERLDWAGYDPGAPVATGPLGLVEPTGPRLGSRALENLDLVLVPALAADRTGNRLGRGGGYYDRTLRGVTSTVVAVVYDAELITAVPTDDHDRRVHAVLRPCGLSRTEGS